MSNRLSGGDGTDIGNQASRHFSSRGRLDLDHRSGNNHLKPMTDLDHEPAKAHEYYPEFDQTGQKNKPQRDYQALLVKSIEAFLSGRLRKMS
jgi:hypothetical protein